MKHSTLVFGLAAIALTAHTALSGHQPARAQTGPQPGEVDPVGAPTNYYLLRDDEFFAPSVNAADYTFQNQTYYADTNLNIVADTVQLGPAVDHQFAPQLSAAAGRVTTGSYDQVIHVERTDGSGGHVGVFFEDKNTGGPVQSTLIEGLADRAQNTADFLDVAVGDLDKLPDSAGNYHDEVVVVNGNGNTTDGYAVILNVLDYTDPGTDATKQPVGVATAKTSRGIDPPNFFLNNTPTGGPQIDNVLSVVTADLDGDGVDEIAVAHVEDYTQLWITTFRYTNDGKGNRTLTEAKASQIGGDFLGMVALEAGDFNGDGREELAAGVAQNFGTAAGSTIQVLTLQPDSSLGVAVANRYDPGQPSSNAPVRVELSAGLFKFDPANGYNFGRRQLAVGWVDQYSTLAVTALNVDTTLQMSQLSNIFTPFGAGGTSGLRFSIASGGYRGVQNANDPTWGVAIRVIFDNTDNSPNLASQVAMFDVGAQQIKTLQGTTLENALDADQRMPLVAYDRDGDSLYLGAPVHFILDQAVRTDYILQEPPKHVFYDGVPNNWNGGKPSYQIINISRYDNFNINLTDAEGKTFSSQSQDNSDWTIGGSESASASLTVKASESIPDVESVSVESTTTLGESAGYDYNQNNTSYDSQYASRTLTVQDQTDHDDYVGGQKQTYDLWRYRLYGTTVTTTKGTTANAFYEVVLPGPNLPFSGGGLSSDWYQPLHENGNILSYPGVLGSDANNPFLPSDLGVYTDTNGSVVQSPLVQATQQGFGGTSGSISLQFSDTTGSGKTRSYSHTLKESLDASRSFKATASVGDPDIDGGSVTGEVSLSVNFHNSNSWGGLSTSSQTTNDSKGISLVKPSGNATQGYTFYPVFYITQDGTVKATHAVNVLGDAIGQQFWAGVYGAKSDPALNLPNRLVPYYSPTTNTLVNWSPSTSSIRKQMRGFFILNSQINPVSGTYDPLALAPKAGDVVQVQARVYNYSTGQAASQVPVQFQAIGYDANADAEIPMTSCPGGQPVSAQGRCTLGQTTIPSMNPLQMVTATVTWNTTGFGPALGDASTYRIYVVLDPGDTIAETYEAENPKQNYIYVNTNGARQTLKGIDPGQNNEGYGYATVVAPAPSRSSAATAPSTSSAVTISNPGRNANVYLTANSLATVDIRDGALRMTHTQALVNEPLRIRATVYSDKAHDEFSYLLVYDGNPTQGGKLIADKLVHSGNTKGSSVWFEWVPLTLGPHELFARVVKDRDDPNPANGVDSTAVLVRDGKSWTYLMPSVHFNSR